MDHLAKQALFSAVESNSFISTPFPFGYFRCFTGFGKISGPPTAAIYDWQGYNTAKQLFHERDIVSREHFDLIYWDGMPKAVKSFQSCSKFGPPSTSHISVAPIDIFPDSIPQFRISAQAAVNPTKALLI